MIPYIESYDKIRALTKKFILNMRETLKFFLNHVFKYIITFRKSSQLNVLKKFRFSSLILESHSFQVISRITYVVNDNIFSSPL